MLTMEEKFEEDVYVAHENIAAREIGILRSQIGKLNEKVTQLVTQIEKHLSKCHTCCNAPMSCDRTSCHPSPISDPDVSKYIPIRTRQEWYTRNRQEFENRKFHRTHKEEKQQECLRKSLQSNIVDIVENLPFSESELSDMLIEAECLTEDECCDIRTRHSKKDQVRNLIRVIKGRSFRVMESFLKCVEELNPELAKIVWSTYNAKMKENSSRPYCTFCKLKHSTNIKFIADHVWSMGAIGDTLYDEIVEGALGGDELWDKLSTECNNSDQTHKVIDTIVKAIEKKGHYKELVTKLRREKMLKCRCRDTRDHVYVALPEIMIDFDDSTTASPQSSMSSLPEDNWKNMSDLESDDIEPDDEYLSSNQYLDYLRVPEIDNCSLENIVNEAYGRAAVTLFRKFGRAKTIEEIPKCDFDSGFTQNIPRSNSIGRHAVHKTINTNLNQMYLGRRRASMFV